MDRLSPPPSPSGGSTGRRLSELLDEQQEPFSLDLYLLEKGCSPKLLDAAAAGGATSTCWPRSSTAAMARRAATASKNTSAAGLLRLLLSMLLRGTAAARKKKKTTLPRPATIDWRAAVDVLEQKPPGCFKNAASSSPCSGRLDGAAAQADMAVASEEEDEEELDDDDSSKQLSPVSVLEPRPFEQAAPVYVQKAMAIFRELMEAANTPAAGSEKSKHCRSDMSATAAPTTTADRTAGAAHWEEVFEAELCKVQGLVAAEMVGAGVGPRTVRPERQDVGSDVAAAVLEALTVEVAVELIGMDHDDAIDDGRRCWRTAGEADDDVDICQV